MKRGVIRLEGGLLSHRWTMPLIGQFSEHNFRHVERDISCPSKLFPGILALYISSKRLCSQAIFSVCSVTVDCIPEARLAVLTACLHM